MHAGQTAQLFVGLGARLLGQTGLVQSLFQLFQIIFALWFAFTQLLPDGLELFAQEVIFLGLVHAFAGRTLNAGLHRGHFHFTLKLGVDQGQAFQRIFRFQNALGIRDFHAHVGGDKIRQAARIVHALQYGQHVRRGQAAQGEHFFALLTRGAQQRLQGGVGLGRGRISTRASR